MLTGLDPYVGPAAGVLTSVLWSFTALFFTEAGRRIGATVVNAVRIALAIVFLAVTHWLISGHWLPDVNLRQAVFLAGSGLVGLSIGDLALFTAFVRVGPRLSMLVMTTAPIFAALFGWLALGEQPHGLAWVGMMLTIGGVAWVVLERPAKDDRVVRDGYVSGIVLAFIGAACQAGGLLLSKQGIGHGWMPREMHLDPQAATLVRMFFAGVFVLPTIWWHRRRVRAARCMASPSATDGRTRRAGYAFTLCGAIVGPFLGVWMSLVASDRAPLAIAQTTMSLTPVFILPLVIVTRKEHVSPRAALGALLAVVGVALLFVRTGE